MGTGFGPRSRETFTAADSAKVTDQIGSVGGVLGRYRIEGAIGAGAIGVVYAAFDPDLERRIALKVLRVVEPTQEARRRLLREARAMARLAHPNVVTVYEVGTAAGRDFVAMELVRGESLIEWLGSRRRSTDAILDVFIAAGRGLAAAHAAGIVHRDFKPQNVLRSVDGRVAVTDFGLAHEVQGEGPATGGLALPVAAQAATASSDSRLTATGAVLGTPAYMAPEQWNGASVTPATDQFAFCVALWEALARERPYRGATLFELKDEALLGPAGLDASRLPRRVRSVLRRGLDPDPARRWPSMDALLVQLARRQRRPQVASAAAGAIVAGAALLAATYVQGTSASACEPPARDPSAVWSPAIATEVRTRTSDAHAAVLADADRLWQATRARACAAIVQVRQAELSCLDGVLERFDALRRAYQRVPEASAEDLQAQMIDPSICMKPSAAEVPRIKLPSLPIVVEAYELYARSMTDHKPADPEIARLWTGRETHACASVIAALAFEASSTDVAQKRSQMAMASHMADRCGDERLRADFLIRDVPYHMEHPVIGVAGKAAIDRAEDAVTHVFQSDLDAALAAYRAVAAHQQGQWDGAFQQLDQEAAGYRLRGLRGREIEAVVMRNYLRLARASAGDVEAIAGDVETARPIAIASRRPELVRQLDVLGAMARFQLGDAIGAGAELRRLWRAQRPAARSTGARRITGVVVDARGRPVDRATVAVGSSLRADSVGIALPVFRPHDGFQDLDLRVATTDVRGRFAIEGAPQAGVIAAQLDDRRSMPAPIADQVRLVLEPTRTIAGTVDLQGMSHTRIDIYCTALLDRTGRFTLIAPVGPDGSFTISGAPVGRLRIGAMNGNEFNKHVEFQTVEASPAAASGIRLRVVASGRTIDVIVRSTVTGPLEGAWVDVFAGKHSIDSVEDLGRLWVGSIQGGPAKHVVGQPLPLSVLARIRPDDLVAHIADVPPGDLTVCAHTYAEDPLDPGAHARSVAHLSQLTVDCEQVGRDATTVELAASPQPRLDALTAATKRAGVATRRRRR